MVILLVVVRAWMFLNQGTGDIHNRIPSTMSKVTHATSIATQDTTTPKLTQSTTTTTTTRGPFTDKELTEMAETRPITVLFIGDRSYSTISKEQFMIYAQSQLNLINAAFAENNIKLKMKVYDTYVMNEEQEKRTSWKFLVDRFSQLTHIKALRRLIAQLLNTLGPTSPTSSSYSRRWVSME
ncbi:uncharacterized protein LOC135394534 [Ornithodoros turicata]|uniref:uncharacterized protein LOC135394534 n=1 Tax=Ornithodoros turicata TaxID=34597 RepID=UPI003139DD53